MDQKPDDLLRALCEQRDKALASMSRLALQGHGVTMESAGMEKLRVLERLIEAHTRAFRQPANWDKIIGAFPDMPDNPKLLRTHPFTCGACRAEIRTDLCPACANNELGL